MFIVDSQVHVWAADRPDRPWPKSSHVDTSIGPAFGAEDLLALMESAGVSRAVLVPPAHEGNRNDVVEVATARYPTRFAAMGRLALDDAKSRRLVPNWLERRGMLGFRINVATEPGRTLLHDGSVDWFWPACEAAGIPLMVLAAGTDVASVDRLEDVALRHPSLRITLDHLMLHFRAGEKPRLDLDAIAQVCRLAARPNVAAKASALPLFSAWPYPFRDLHDPIHRVVDAYGPKRVFWGTDLTRLSCSYSQAISLFTEELPWISSSDLEWVMGRAVCDWLGWPI